MQNSRFKHINGFSYTQRIPRRVGFKSCLNSNQISDSCFKVFYISNSSGISRLGIVAAKRLLPRAVDRNSAKRQIRHLFRLHKIKYLGVDLVVMIRKSDQVRKTSKIDGLSKLFNRVVTQCAGS